MQIKLIILLLLFTFGIIFTTHTVFAYYNLGDTYIHNIGVYDYFHPSWPGTARGGCIVESSTDNAGYPYNYENNFYRNEVEDAWETFILGITADKITCDFDGVNSYPYCDHGTFVPCDDDDDCQPICSTDFEFSAKCVEMPGQPDNQKYCKVPVRAKADTSDAETNDASRIYYWCHPCRLPIYWGTGPGDGTQPYQDINEDVGAVWGLGQPCENADEEVDQFPWECPEPFTCIDNVCRINEEGALFISDAMVITTDGTLVHKSIITPEGSVYTSKSDYNPNPRFNAGNFVCNDYHSPLRHFNIVSSIGTILLSACAYDYEWDYVMTIRGNYQSEYAGIDTIDAKFKIKSGSDVIFALDSSGNAYSRGTAYNMIFERYDSQLWPGYLVGENAIVPPIW